MTLLDPPSDTLPAEVDIAIVGSGFSGLGMAIRLKRDGVEDFVVLERGDKVGGTWWVNTYPGCGCDVPSHLYSFSFAPNPEWTRTYSKQPEIEAYLQRVADDFGASPHVRLNTTVTGAAWDDDARRWTVETSRGSLRARVLVSAAGRAQRSQDARDPGARALPGPQLPLRPVGPWLRRDRQADRGDRHGRSAIQFVPAIAPKVERLHVYQRTAPWVMPHSDRPISGFERRLYRRFPQLQRLLRGGIYAGRELLVLGFVKEPRIMRLVQRIAERHIARQVSDPELRAGSAPTTRSAASASCPPTTGIRRSRATTSSWSRSRSPRSASTRSSPSPARSTRSTRSCSAPASTSSTCRSPGTCAAATAARWTRPGAAARARTSARPSPASPTCSCCSAPTPGSGTARWST